MDSIQSIEMGMHARIVVEHHPTILAICDWIIELGPKGGEAGGYIISSCPPTKVKDTPHAPYVKKLLEI